MATFTASPELATSFRPVRTSRLARVDVVLVVATAALSAIGMVMVYTSTRAHRLDGALAGQYFLKRQAGAVAIGVVAAIIAATFDYRKLRETWIVLYASMIPLLLIVRVVGQGRGGTTAWFNIGPFQFQPSEIAKLVVIVAIAGYCHEHQGDLDAYRLGVALALAAVPMALVMLQNDLGTMLVMAVCVIAVLVVAGLRARQMLVLALVASSMLGVLVYTGAFESYRIDRLVGFLKQEDPNKSVHELTNTEYSYKQSKAAISHGGLSGQGLYKGRLTQLAFVPEQRTDFIFTAVGEELGFAGGAVVLALFALICWRLWRIASLMLDRFGSLIAIGLVAMFAFQVFENMGMTMGMMPITGIPLPFMSYGGSAMIAYWVAIGFATGIWYRR